MKPVLIDTGVIVALFDRSEKQHSTCVEAVQGIAAPLVTCEAVISESCYLLRGLRGASEAVMQNVVAGIFQISFQVSTGANEIRRILKKYQDRKIDLADACLVQMAHDHETSDILTLDSDFHIYRWGKNKPFRVMPQI
jgi:predicted nucleic acid-binding protein